MRFENDNNALVCYHQGEILRLEAWGEDSLRVRATMHHGFTGNVWALTEKVKPGNPSVVIAKEDHWVGDGTIDKKDIATITNGRIKAVVNFAGVISFR